MSLPDQLLPMVNRPASTLTPAPMPIATPAQINHLLAMVDELATSGFITSAQQGELHTAITRAAEKRGIAPHPPTGRDGLPH